MDSSRNRPGDYPHFMLKEIMEQPQVLRKTFAESITSDQKIKLGAGGKEELAGYKRLLIIWPRIFVTSCPRWNRKLWP